MEANIYIFERATHHYCYRCGAVRPNEHTHVYNEYPVCWQSTADRHEHPAAEAFAPRTGPTGGQPR
jgi:hypothetical protein